MEERWNPLRKVSDALPASRPYQRGSSTRAVLPETGCSRSARSASTPHRSDTTHGAKNSPRRSPSAALTARRTYHRPRFTKTGWEPEVYRLRASSVAGCAAENGRRTTARALDSMPYLDTGDAANGRRKATGGGGGERASLRNSMRDYWPRRKGSAPFAASRQ